MNKLSVLAALGCTQAHQIDLFTPETIAKMGGKPSMVQQMLDYATSFVAVDDNLKLGEVTFSQCDDDTNSFTLDSDQTTSEPNPVVKGSKVQLDLFGIVADKIEIKNVHIHVDWNGTPLYDEDNSQDNTFENEEYTYNLGWDVPSFAPSGAYDIHLKAYGDEKDTSGPVLYCVEAQMTL